MSARMSVGISASEPSLLREIAEKATQHKLEAKANSDGLFYFREVERPNVVVATYLTENDGEHFEAFQPATAIALLDELEKARAERDFARGLLRGALGALVISEKEKIVPKNTSVEQWAKRARAALKERLAVFD
jgi:hypothetical protein